MNLDPANDNPNYTPEVHIDIFIFSFQRFLFLHLIDSLIDSFCRLIFVILWIMKTWWRRWILVRMAPWYAPFPISSCIKLFFETFSSILMTHIEKFQFYCYFITGYFLLNNNFVSLRWKDFFFFFSWWLIWSSFHF